MANSWLNPDYRKRLHLQVEGDRLMLRRIVSFPGCLWAWLLSVLASLPMLFLVDRYGIPPSDSLGNHPLLIVGVIVGTTFGGTLLYIAVAQLFRHRIVLDRAQNRVLVGRREVGLLSDVSHIVKAAGLLNWCRLNIVFKNGRKVFLLKCPQINDSAGALAEVIAGFAGVPFKDHGEGDYIAILRLVIAGDRLTMRPPDEVRARWVSYPIGGALGIGALYIAMVIFPRQTGHPMQGTRGLTYIVVGLAVGIHFLMTRLFHRRIALDRRQDRLFVGRKAICGLRDIDHIGLHIGKNYAYHMAFILTGGREIPIVYYGGRPPTTTTAANIIGNFLRVRVVDYYRRERTETARVR